VGDQLGHVGQVLALAVDAHRRDPQALRHVVEGADVERARHGAADIGPVTVRLSEAQQLALVEHRREQTGVVEVGAALVDVVDDEGVAGMDVVLELLDDGLGGVVQRAHVGGDIAAALHDGVAVGVAERRGEIARVDDEGIAGPQDLFRHLVDDVHVGVLQDLERHRIQGITFSVDRHFSLLVCGPVFRPHSS